MKTPIQKLLLLIAIPACLLLAFSFLPDIKKEKESVSKTEQKRVKMEEKYSFSFNPFQW